MPLDDPAFPPLLTPVAVPASEAALEHAARLAASGELGAGDVVWSRARDRAELALVLEPELVLGRALEMGPLAMVALGDCLGALMPPKTALAFRWPDTCLVNGGEAGRLRLRASTRRLDEVPDWLVVGLVLRLTPAAGSGEPGERPDHTSLAAEGGGDLSRSEILQSFAAHVLAWLDIWTHEGFGPVRDRWRAREYGGGTDVLNSLGNMLASGDGRGGGRA